MDQTEKWVPCFTDIPWVDVLFCHLFPRLGPKDLFNLRVVSKALRALVTEYLRINKCLDFSSIARSTNINVFKILTQDAHRLKFLNLRDCKWLDSQALDSVFLSNREIVHLDISNCFSVSNSSLLVLANRGSVLRHLNLGNCHWLNGAAITSISQNCPLLEFIDLTSCWEVTDEAVCDLAINCPSLQSISVSQVYGITDKSLVVLAHKSKYLESLNLKGCWRISDYGVRLVGEYCSKLKCLQIADCRHVTEQSLFNLRMKHVSVDRPARNLYVIIPRLPLQI